MIQYQLFIIHFILFNRKFRCCSISNMNIRIFSNFVWNKINHFLIFLPFFKQKQSFCRKLRKNFNIISIHGINSYRNNEKWQIWICFFFRFYWKKTNVNLFLKKLFFIFSIYSFFYIFLYFYIFIFYFFKYLNIKLLNYFKQNDVFEFCYHLYNVWIIRFYRKKNNIYFTNIFVQFINSFYNKIFCKFV